MDVRTPFFQNIASVLIGVLFLNPIVATAAELALDAQAGGNASLGQAGNGVPVVNIATPNGSGLSHNTFSDFNVGQQGLILNNTTDRLQSTQLGGIIVGNSNLKGGAANLILNEVTGSNTSQLRGYTEVAGKSAAVIVANPHGITCDGCGFINTPRVTLSTGRPVIEGGRLDRFDVNSGQINIEGNGLNASNIEQFDLITRSAKINAELYANKLNVITGRNQVKADDLAVTAKTDDGSAKPLLAIDSSALGGMYAGAIRLVGSEAGVGVKLAGNMAASAGDIQIDANGKLSMAQAAASGNIQLQAASAELNGKTYAGGSINAQTAAELVNRQSLAARERIDINTAQLNNSGLIEAGVEADNSRNARGDVNVLSQSVRNSGNLLASRNLGVQASQSLDNQGGTLSAQNSQVSAGQLDNRQGRVLASGALTVTAGSVDNRQNGLLHSQNSATIETSGTLNNQAGRVIGLNTLSVNAGVLDNSQGGLLASQQQLTINTGNLNNQAGEVSANSIDARVAGLNNRNGKLIADQLKVRAAAQVDNRQGRIEATKTLELAAASLDNSGQGTLLSQGSLALNVSGLLDNHAQGNLISHGAQQVSVGQLDNSAGGLLSSKSTLALQGAVLNNQAGLVIADGAVTIKGASLDNRQQGSVNGKSSLLLELTQLNNTGGSVASDGRLQLTAATVDNGNDGQIAAKGDLQAQLGSLNQQGGALISQSVLTLHANSIDNRNAGLIAANQGIELHAENVDNQGGEISSRAQVRVTASELRNSAGKVIGDQGLELTVQRLLNQARGLLAGRDRLTLRGVSLDNSQGGLLSSQQALRVELAGALDNHAQGQLISEGGLLVTAASLDNSQAGVLSSAGALQVTTQDRLNNQGGKLLTDAALTLNSADLDNSQAGVLSAKGAIELHSRALDNQHGGRIAGDSTLKINATQLNNSAQGRIASQGLLTANLTGLDQHDQGELVSSTAITLDLANGQLNNNHGGLLASSGQLLLSRVASIDNSQGGEVSSQRAFNLLTGSLNNSAGKIISGETLQLQINQALLNSLSGILSGAQGLTVSAASLDNSNGGTLASRGDVQVDVSAALDNSNNGALVASGDLRVNSGALNNSNKGLLSSGNNLRLSSGATNNNAGQLISQASLDADTGDLNNQGGVLSSKQRLSLHSADLDNTRSGLISSQGNLNISAQRLDSSLDGEVSGKGDLLLSVTQLIQRQGRLIGDQAVTLDLAGGNFDNRGGLLSAHGPLSIQRLQELDNRDQGEISSQQSFSLLASKVDNGEQGRIISADTLNVNVATLRNANAGLISGWQGLTLQGNSLDNSSSGTLSSKQGALTVTLSGALDNHEQGALVSKALQQVTAASLNNSNGILSSEGNLELAISGQLNNSAQGLINAKQDLKLNSQSTDVNNQGGELSGANVLLTGSHVNNSGGQISSQGQLQLTLLGALINANHARLASGGALNVSAASVDNRGGQLISQNALTLNAAHLDNSRAGTLASQQDLQLNLTGALSNQQDGLLYSQLGKLLLNAGSLNNQDGTLQGATDSQLRITGALHNQHGRIASQGGNLDLEVGSLDNSSGGILSSARGWLKLLTAGVFDNHAGITQAQSLELNAGQGIDNHNGHLSALTGDNLIVTQDFNNQGGGLYAGTLLKVTGQQFFNQGAALNQGGKVAAGQIDFGLSGALNNQFGILESDSTLSLNASSINNVAGSLRALGYSGSTRIVANSLNNAYGRLDSANQNLDLQVASLSNGAGRILHTGNGNFGLSTDNIIQAGGSLTSNGALTLNAASWVNSSVLQAGHLSLNIGNFSQTAEGQLLASQSFTGSGNSWVNNGLLASDGDFSLNLSGGYSGDGRLSSLGALNLSAASIVLGTPGRISSGGNGQINSSGNLTNYGRLTSASDLRVNASSINNHGTLGSAGALRLTTPSLLNVYGLIFSGEDMALRVNGFTNKYADVYSLGDLDIALDDLGNAAALLDNLSGSIESLGNMSLRAMTVNNARDLLTINNAGKYTAQIIELPCSSYYGAGDCSGKRNGVWQITERDKLEVLASSAAAQLQAGGSLSINAWQLLNSSSLISAGGNIQASLGSLNNQGVEIGEIETKGVFLSERTRSMGSWRSEAAAFTNRYWLTGAAYNPLDYSGLEAALSHFIARTERENLAFHTTTILASADQSYAGIIQAGGNVNITAAEEINNDVVRPYYTYVSGGSKVGNTGVGSAVSTQVSLNAQLPPDLAQQQINPVTLPGFSLPTGQNGLFRLSGQNAQNGVASVGPAGASDLAIGGRQIDLGQREQTLGYQGAQRLTLAINELPATSTGAAQVAATLAGQATAVQQVQGLSSSSKTSSSHKYLIETNPELTNLKQFLGSDYMLGNLGYTPDNTQKRLGDGLYEQRLIREAVIARTGQRFLAGLNSDEAMFRYLMDNAIASKQALNLSVGVSLSAEQVAALTHDLVWLEEYVVNGEKVLVPVVYLAQAKNRLAPNGALIQGQDVALISGGDLLNQGTLRASNNLSAGAAGSISNRGLIEASNRLELLATNSIRNAQGGIIAGRDVSLTALTGDVINERSVTVHQSASGNRTWERSFADSAARIEASNRLDISAGRDIANLGSVMQSRGDLDLYAGRDVTIASVEARNSQTNGSRHSTSNVTQLGAEVAAGRDLTTTTSPTAAGNLSINAGRDLNVIASQLEARRDISLTAERDVTLAAAANESHSYSKSKKVTRQEDHVRQQATEVNAGGDVFISAGQDLTLLASKVEAGQEAYLVAGNNIALLSAEDQDYSYYSKKKKSGGLFSSTKTTMSESSSSQAVASSIHSGSDLTLVANNDITARGAQLSSAEAILAYAGNDIVLDAAENTASQASGKSKSSLFSSKASTQSSASTSLTSTSLNGKSVELLADNDITLRAAAVHAEEGIILDAGRDIAISTAQQSQQSSQASKSNKLNWHLTDSLATNGSFTLENKAKGGQQNSVQEVGSTLSGATIDIDSGRDTTIRGSTLVADRNIRIDAVRNLSVVSGETSNTSSASSKTKNTGEIGNWYQGATGVASLKESNKNSSVTQTASQIASLGGNVDLKAGERYHQVASHVIAPEGDISIIGKQVDIEAGYDKLSESQKQSSSRTALGGSVSVPLVDAVRNIQQMGNAAENTGDARLKSLAAVNVAMNAQRGYEAAQAMGTGDFTGIKVSVNLSNSKGNSSSSQSGQNVVSSTIAAGRDVNISAVGDGKNSNLNVVGSQIEAVRDVNLKAGGDINLLSAQNTAQQRGDNANSGWSVGVGFGIGGTQNGFTLDLAANKGKGNSDGESVTQSNTAVRAGNVVTLTSGADTTLKGAVVSANQVKADVGGDFNLVSLQDIDNYKSKQKDASVGISLCIPPFCFGVPSGGTASFSQQKINSEYASVIQQTGIKAGDGGFQINVKGNTDLKGAVITSSDKAVAENRNTLTTGTLTHSTIENKAEYNATSISLSGGYSGDAYDKDGNVIKGADGKPLHEPGVTAGTPIALSASGKDSSKTLSGISGGVITITDAAKQQQLTGESADEAVAGINRDVSSDKDGSNALKPIFDRKEIEAGFEITRQFVQNVGAFLNDRAKESTDDKRKLEAEKAKPVDQQDPVYIAALAQQILDNKTWETGGTGRALLSALGGAAGGNVTGGSAQLLQGAAVNYLQGLATEQVKRIADYLDSETARTALQALVGCAGAAAQSQSCGSGALGASASVVLNNLIERMRGGDASTLTDEEKQTRLNLIGNLVAGITAAAGGDAAVAANAANIETANNYLESGDSISFGLDMASCGGDEACQRKKWADQGYREESIYNDDFARGVSGREFAKDKMGQVAAGLAELTAMECDTATCEAYKAELLGSALKSYQYLSDIAGEWAPSMDRLSLLLGGAVSPSPGGLKPRPAGSPGLTGGAQVEKAIEYFAKLKGAKGPVGIGKGVTGRTQLDPAEISFSQATVAYQKKNSTLNYDDLVQSMRKDGWQGAPVDVVKMPNGAPTSVDNTRILAAREAGIKVEANVRNYNDPISRDQAVRFVLNGKVPKTWGQAVEFRVQKQSQMSGVDKSWSEKFPSGSIYDPDITR